jgi:hypothetical protein
VCMWLDKINVLLLHLRACVMERAAADWCTKT